MDQVEPDGVRTALAAALAGGPAFAPLPADSTERAGLTALLGRGSARPETAVVVTTSGSTGAPKGVELSAAAIRASCTATHARLGGPRPWLLALPTHYVAGLMVLARAAVGGTAVVPVGADLAGLATAPPGAYLSVVATQLGRALASTELTRGLARCAAVLLGGGPADPGLLHAARSAGISVVTTYGMSETCGGCVYDGVPLDGVSVDLTDGRIGVDGPVLFSGYWGGGPAPDRPWRTADRGRWSENRLQVLGRVDDVVISGGMNVDLAAVERAAGGWPEEVAVLGVPDPEWGTAVVAVADEPTGLRDRFADRLPAYAVPRVVDLSTLGHRRMPRTAGGKIDRRALLALLTREDRS